MDCTGGFVLLAAAIINGIIAVWRRLRR